MGGWGMLAGGMSGGTISVTNGNWGGSYTTATTGSATSSGVSGTLTTNTYGGSYSVATGYGGYYGGYSSSNGSSASPGTPTASDADGDGQIDEVGTTAGIIRWGTNLGLPIPSLPFNLALSFDFQAFYEDLKEKYICAILHDANEALGAINTQINGINLEDDTFDALQNVVRGAFILGDVLSFRGLSLTDVLTNLGTLNIQDGPLNGVPGVYIPDGNNILIDVAGIRDRVNIDVNGDAASFEEFLLNTIIHEIGHSQDEITGGPATPWTTHYSSQGDNSLQMWAEQIAARMLRHAEQNGFETFDEFMDDMGAKCAAGHGGGQNQIAPTEIMDLYVAPEGDSHLDFAMDAFF